MAMNPRSQCACRCSLQFFRSVIKSELLGALCILLVLFIPVAQQTVQPCVQSALCSAAKSGPHFLPVLYVARSRAPQRVQIAISTIYGMTF